jgi:hypothetical protein
MKFTLGLQYLARDIASNNADVREAGRREPIQSTFKVHITSGS